MCASCVCRACVPRCAGGGVACVLLLTAAVCTVLLSGSAACDHAVTVVLGAARLLYVLGDLCSSVLCRRVMWTVMCRLFNYFVPLNGFIRYAIFSPNSVIGTAPRGRNLGRCRHATATSPIYYPSVTGLPTGCGIGTLYGYKNTFSRFLPHKHPLIYSIDQ